MNGRYFLAETMGREAFFSSRIAKLVEWELGAAGGYLWEVLPAKEAGPKKAELKAGQKGTPDDFLKL